VLVFLYKISIVEMLDFLVRHPLLRNPATLLLKKLKRVSRSSPFLRRSKLSPSTNDTDKSSVLKKKWKKLHEKSKRNILDLTLLFSKMYFCFDSGF